jgi:hypothetical protein
MAGDVSAGDVSPNASRATFLGAWRLFADVGNGVGPLAVAAMTSLTDRSRDPAGAIW